MLYTLAALSYHEDTWPGKGGFLFKDALAKDVKDKYKNDQIVKAVVVAADKDIAALNSFVDWAIAAIGNSPYARSKAPRFFNVAEKPDGNAGSIRK